MATITFPPSPSPATPSKQGPKRAPFSDQLASSPAPSALSISFSASSVPTRTIAILTKTCAKLHRLTIESKLVAAGFDVLLSRNEEWSYPDDVDFLYELLHGHSDTGVRYWIEHLTGEPIHFMVLERTRAVETWLELIGPGETEEEEEEDDYAFLGGDVSTPGSTRSTKSLNGSSKGLRATYGKGSIYGSLTCQQAQRQIAVCAPELVSEEALIDLHMSFSCEADESLPIQGTGLLNYEEDESADQSQIQAMLQGDALDPDNGEVLSDGGAENSIVRLNETRRASARSTSTTEALSSDAPGRKTFRAKPVPASLATPAIQPRLTRAAALRMGIQLPDARIRGNKTEVSETAGPVGISGLPKATVPLPKSLAEPTIKPRANRASLVRAGGGAAASAQPTYQRPRKEVDYSNTPGHRRNSTACSVASLAQPTIAPRQNRASLARLGAGAGAGTGTGALRPGITATRSLSMVSVDSARSSATSTQTTDRSDSRSTGARERKPVDFSNTPGHRRDLAPTNLASLKPPAITPRTNKAAMARGGVVNGSIAPSMTTSPSRVTAPTTASRSTSLPMPTSSGRSSPVKSDRTAAMIERAPSQMRERKPVDFSTTPGHKKTQSFSIASLAAPKIQPRLNNAASKRLSLGGAAERPNIPLNLPVPPSRPGSALAGKMGRTSVTPMPPPLRSASSIGIRRAISDAAPHQDFEVTRRLAEIKMKTSTNEKGGVDVSRSENVRPVRARAPPPSAYRAPSAQVA
ncbi:hypothetical protein BCV69DRAFT_310799 [Microstroma glucosiphilum]|uniref:Nucleoside diphosphate kinase n=1 Tax=Pseudomicrostroma glucosiphilum TaxID=1684307 RepID=A0A316UHC3_9BASI|nr:hypothetical protein BCV69DRAFT_310799 [Pseudomicrostroma glucosiphilum]PWN23333.1 hypothetical protein BCV69DRAFT_310799 [Pseudomicrostroma glucosiphilum]